MDLDFVSRVKLNVFFLFVEVAAGYQTVAGNQDRLPTAMIAAGALGPAVVATVVSLAVNRRAGLSWIFCVAGFVLLVLGGLVGRLLHLSLAP